MRTIFIHDNDDDILSLLSYILKESGYSVHVTSVLDEHILELIAEANPDVILVDFIYNGQDAIAACNLIRAFYPNLPVIATSCDSNIREKYQSVGFVDYLDKPFDLVTLDTLVRKHAYASN